MAPDRILPAAIREDEARELLRRWAKEHRIDAPSEPLEAGYLPFWVIEVDGEIVSPAAPLRRPGADLAVTLTRALAALRPGMYRTLDRQLFREIDHESDRRPVDRLPLSHHATVPAARRMPELLNEIRLAGATVPPAFDSSLLAGWPAEGCQVPVGEAMAEAHAQVISRAKREFRSWFRGRVRYDSSGLAMADFDLLLIPLWMTAVGTAGGGQRACAHAVTGEIFVGRAPGRL
jgi:hypothetical protein